MKLSAVVVLPLLLSGGAVAWAAQPAPVSSNVYAEAGQSQEPYGAPQSSDDQQAPAAASPSMDTESEGSESSEPRDTDTSGGAEE